MGIHVIFKKKTNILIHTNILVHTYKTYLTNMMNNLIIVLHILYTQQKFNYWLKLYCCCGN